MRTHSQLMPSKQHGSALIIALSILMVLTIFGVSALGTSSLEEKMAGNTRDQQVAFEAAEEALRAAERFIDGLATTGSFNAAGAGGLFTPKGTNPDAFTTDANWTTAAYQSSTISDVARQPQYIIQLVDAKAGQVLDPNADTNSYNSTSGQGEVTIFQITARGYGISANSRVMLQTYYSKIF